MPTYHLTRDQFEGLKPGTIIQSLKGKEYVLTEFIPEGSGGGYARWWIKPVAGTRRRQFTLYDFHTYGYYIP